MALRHALTTLAILLGLWQNSVAQPRTAPMLEIHVNTPKWVNGCLDLTIERVNVSTQTIYLPEWEGVIFQLSTKLIRNSPSTNEEVWLAFYGLSDIVYRDAQKLAAGAKATDHFCLPETAAVVNQQEKTRREVAVRGHVRIVASYFPTEEDWKTNEAEWEKHWPMFWHSPSASLDIALPCLPQSECTANCTIPAPIVEGEGCVVPDVFQYNRDWNKRGKALGEALNRKYSACKN